ncbi:hypothetical protein BFP72_17710 [Reichenbachiella sp. 5M10]|uniref:hypothetical protein n=1 Tax=Reichenbachiella sp. 5M10 TaxID=1889772 RepID=UPI000C157FAB|nr:hypothetical protein [Reichenbachiella sp. 5M10]PIB37110.1 hypothetical protein BFP72_17710 [Reichenbachiella sp. 5M10]
MDEQIHQLYTEYIKYRRISLSKEQFVYLTKLYPALLVCMSDGVLDQEEWNGIVMATRGLAAEFESPTDDRDRVAMAFRTEIRYLLDNIDKWNKKFLNALQHSIKEDPLDQEFVLETMYLFANIAGGISEEEEASIRSLSNRLGIKN